MQNKTQEFKEIYNKHRSKIYKLCFGYAGNADLAKDLLQDTFIKVWENLDKFRNESAISTWIYRIAVNTCLSYLRSEKNKPKDPLSDFILETKPEEINEKNQQVALLYKCINQLEENDRMIITMVLDEVEYLDIAQVFGISEGNLRVKIHRIKQKLTEIYNYHARL
ncbi:MAG: RNA polymerase sigma factor [Bacteroidia bacterium]|nr:RNA polymerase sigma factor [Bacteroidia bacterium]